MHTPETGGAATPTARAVLYAHGFMAAVSALLLIAFAPSMGGPRVPVLYGLMYSSFRWKLFQLEFYAVPVMFIVMVFALTGPTRWVLKDAMRTSVHYKRVLVWSWVLMLLAWFALLAIATGGRAA